MTTYKLIGCCLGIFCCYFYYGIIQEKITRSKYGPDKEPFTFTLSLVFVQCVVNALFAFGVLHITLRTSRGEATEDTTPHTSYAACSFSYLAAMLSSNQALQYVPYPTQVLGKSCKPIPIMIMGVLIARKVYPLLKYLFVLLIVLGVSLFLYKDGKKSDADSSTATFGLILLALSLAMDGMTGGIQDRMRAAHQTKSYYMMLNMNLWSTVYLVICLISTQEIFSFAAFLSRYPYLAFDMLSFSVASSFGQYFIFVTVTEFSPLTCSIVTTTRKFFTILASVIIFGNSLTNRQWLGTLLVFAGLTLDAVFSKKLAKAKAEKDSPRKMKSSSLSLDEAGGDMKKEASI